MELNLDGFSKHDHSVALHNGHTSKSFARLEAFDDERLLGFKDNLSNFIGLHVLWVLDLSTTSFLAHLPVDGLDLASRSAGTDVCYWGISHLELAWVIQNLNLGSECGSALQSGVLLKNHHITYTRHVQLLQTLHIEPDVITWASVRYVLVMHFNREDFSLARSGSSMSREEKNLILRLDDTLLDTTSDHITDTLDLVDTRDRHTKGSRDGTGRDPDHLLEGIRKGLDVDLLLANKDITSLPPAHVGRLVDEVVANPSRDRDNWNALGDKVLLPANLHEHSGDLSSDFIISLLSVLSNVTVHLVDTNDELLDTQQVEEAGMLASLTLHLSGLVVTLGNGGDKVTIGGNHEKSNISLGGTSDHVLDEITMARRIDDGVVVRGCEKLLGSASDCDTTSPLLLRLVHVEGESERILTESLGLILELLHFTIGNAAKFKDESAGGGRLAGIDMATDDDRNVLLSLSHLGKLLKNGENKSSDCGLVRDEGKEVGWGEGWGKE